MKNFKKSKRTIIFGDIHGCFREWKRLMKKLKVTPHDRLICAGDMICKGPSSKKVLDFARELPNLTCVLGNHERRLFSYKKRGIKNELKPCDRKTIRQLGKRFPGYLKWISKWPLYVQGKNWIVVHGGLRPRITLKKQKRWDLTSLRTVGPELKPWYDLYQGKKIVAFGHWPRRKPLVKKNAVGLDTGCVYGGKLSALVFPGRKIVTVRAAKAYASHEKF